MKNIMVDLETMGTGPNSAIVAIGAVEFNPENDTLPAEFYVNIKLESCLEHGLQVDGPTIMWWLKQSDAARAALAKEPRLMLTDALYQFKDWCGDPNQVLMWGNGAAFDNTLLRNAYVKCGMEAPWRYSNDRCYRTMRALYPGVKAMEQPNFVAHNALMDAMYQAAHMLRILSFARTARL